MKSSIMALVPLLAAATVARSSRAQTTGTIEGAVLDALTHKPVADAVVVAQSPSLQGEQTAVTDASGRFTITLLPVGTYSLTVQRDGYEPFTERAALAVGLARTVEVRLSIAPTSVAGVEIVVSALRPAIDVGTVQSGGIVTREQMQLVPYGRTQRTFEAVATSIPGVVEDRFGVAIRGSGSPESNYVIDGVNVTDPSVGTMGTTLLQDFVEQVEVKTGGYQAEYGRSSGGVINVVTKSGGNEVHGSLFLHWSPLELPRRRLVFNGTSIASEERLTYALDVGAEIGGPILRDRLWFFAGFAPQLTSLDENRLILAQTDAGNGQPMVGADGTPIVHEVARKGYAQTSTAWLFAGKLTWLVSENHSVAFSAYGNPTTTSGALGNLAGSESSFLYEQQTGTTNLSLHYSGKLLAKRLLLEATVGYYGQSGNPQFPSAHPIPVGNLSAATLHDTPRINWALTRNLLDPHFQDPTTPDYQKDLAACAVQPNGFDPCPVTGYSTGGIGRRLTQQKLDRVSAALKLTTFFDLAGHHQAKFGVDGTSERFLQQVLRSGNAIAFEQPDSGYFDVYRGTAVNPTNPALPSFDPAHPGDLLGPELDVLTRNRSLALFVQDTWAIFDRVVLDVGLRAEAQLMYADSKTIDPTSNAPVSGAQLQLFNVMPRIGLLYDLTGRGLSKAYASYGRFYEFIPLDIATNALSGGVILDYFVDPESCSPPPGTLLHRDPRYCALVVPPGGRAYNLSTEAGTPVDPKLQGQYVDEFQAGTQYQVMRDVVVAVDYAHRTIGRVVEDMSADGGNSYFVSNPGAAGTLGEQVPEGSGAVIRIPPPRRVYDAISLSVRKSFSQNYLLSASYTYSALRGNYPGLFSDRTAFDLHPNSSVEFDLPSLLPNRDGPLPDDVPNSFKLDAGYVLELSPRVTLQFGGDLRIDEGKPINYLGAHPSYGAGEAFILPRGSGGRLPWLWQLDVRAASTWRLDRSYSATLSLDVFNLTNNRVATAVDENYTLDSVNPIVGGSVRDLPYLRTTTGVPATVSASYGNPTAYQLPLSARLGARFSF